MDTLISRTPVPLLHGLSSPLRPRVSRVLIVLAVALALAGCGGGGGGGEPTACLNSSDPSSGSSVPNQSNARFKITNNENQLDQLITCRNDPVPVGATATSTTFGAGGGSAPLSSHNFDLTLVAELAPPKIVGAAGFVTGGGALDDLTAGGTFTGSGTNPPFVRYVVEIDGTGLADTFSWSDDADAIPIIWNATGVPITGGTQALNRGVTISFAAMIGHMVGDRWFIDAGTLQATSVSISGNTAVVSYGMIGAPYLGAIQVLQLTGKTAKLKSQALFRDMDVNAVVASGSAAYAVGAREPVAPTFTIAAALQRLVLSGKNLTLSGDVVDLNSFAGTSVVRDGANSRLFVTDGDQGELAVLDDSTLLDEPGSPIALDDARWVAVEGNLAVVMQGCCGAAPMANGQIATYDVTGVPAPLGTFGITGADVDDAKSTVEVVGAKAFIAAGSGGARVVNTANGALLDRISNPTGTGLPAGLVVANAVSVDDDLMFISNGEAGVYVAQEDSGNFSATGSAGPVNLTLLGALQFGSQESVNHVVFKNDFLIVAAGLGGVKIVSVER